MSARGQKTIESSPGPGGAPKRQKAPISGAG
jgi:hypothetical protein